MSNHYEKYNAWGFKDNGKPGFVLIKIKIIEEIKEININHHEKRND